MRMILYLKIIRLPAQVFFSNLFSFYTSAGKYRTAFDGEVEAIRIALKQLLALKDKFVGVVLLSDSQCCNPG